MINYYSNVFNMLQTKRFKSSVFNVLDVDSSISAVFYVFTNSHKPFSLLPYTFKTNYNDIKYNVITLKIQIN